jgi:RimJ/RimL family protein N-acetyltransferase
MSGEAFQFPPILYTERLTLTLVDFTKGSDEQHFITLLETMMGEILDISSEDAAKRVQGSIDFYRTYGRLQPKFLGGCKANQGAIWLVRLGPNSPQGKCIGTSYVIQRSLIPDQSWILLPGYRGNGYATESAKEVLRYFRDELGLRDLMAVVHPGSPRSPGVATRVGYVPVEGGLKHVDGVTKLLLYVLPTAAPLPKDLLFSQYARVE